MYNYSLQLTYKNDPGDELYRKELLNVFHLEKYDNSVISTEIQNNILPLIEEHFKEIFAMLNKHSTFPFPLDNHLCVTILLSWEYFYLFHLCIGEIKENNVKNSITNLINEIQNK